MLLTYGIVKKVPNVRISVAYILPLVPVLLNLKSTWQSYIVDLCSRFSSVSLEAVAAGAAIGAGACLSFHIFHVKSDNAYHLENIAHIQLLILVCLQGPSISSTNLPTLARTPGCSADASLRFLCFLRFYF